LSVHCTPAYSPYSLAVASALVRTDSASTTHCFDLTAVTLSSPSSYEQFHLRKVEWQVGECAYGT
jgi:hypothetical protein